MEERGREKKGGIEGKKDEMRGNYLIKLHYKFGLPSGKRRQVRGKEGRQEPSRRLSLDYWRTESRGEKGKGDERRRKGAEKRGSKWREKEQKRKKDK